MEIVKDTEKQTFKPIDGVTIHEFVTSDGFISGATAEIKGRYPAKGYVMNQKLKELVYILAGSGKLIMPSGKTSFAAGDMIFLDHKEIFAWEGDMVLFMATTPTFDPAQHVGVEA